MCALSSLVPKGFSTAAALPCSYVFGGDTSSLCAADGTCTLRAGNQTAFKYLDISYPGAGRKWFVYWGGWHTGRCMGDLETLFGGRSRGSVVGGFGERCAVLDSTTAAARLLLQMPMGAHGWADRCGASPCPCRCVCVRARVIYVTEEQLSA
jgi:hypothetical protein